MENFKGKKNGCDCFCKILDVVVLVLFRFVFFFVLPYFPSNLSPKKKICVFLSNFG